MTSARSLSCLISFSLAAALSGCTAPIAPASEYPCRTDSTTPQAGIAKSSSQAIQEAGKTGRFKGGGITSSMTAPVGITVIQTSRDHGCR